jgi:PAS domain S-box-containing protein
MRKAGGISALHNRKLVSTFPVRVSFENPMRPSFRQFGIIAGFALLGLLLVANALVTKHRLDLQSRDAQWALHSRQVQVALEDAESTLKDAETGQRGFLLTGDASYLAPYNRATSQIGPRIDELERLTADNPAQQATIRELRSLTREKMDELAQTIALNRAGNAKQARRVVLSDRGLLIMDKLRLLFAQMRQEETRLDKERDAEYRHSIRMSAISIWLASLAALLGTIALAYFILRERNLRERHAHELRVSEEWFRTTLGSIGDAVIATDRSGNVTFLNAQAEKLVGAKFVEARGKSIGEVFPIFSELTGDAAEDPVKKVMDRGAIVGLANHTVLKKSDGSLIPIEDSAAPIRDDRDDLIGVVLVFRDVTAERKAQEAMRRTEKLAAAARLSATVAHEINNPLAAVVNLIFIAKNTEGVPEAVVQDLVQVEHELERVAHITRQTLGFYRESGTPEMIEVPALIESALRLYSNKIAAKSIKVERAFEDCASVTGVSGELRQAVSNVIANAIDAVDQNGVISIGTRTIPANGSCTVEIIVADNGPGISAEHMDRIFEPFYTTKKDVGTGLGLWAAKTIVERHDGSISVRPDEGNGAQRGAAFMIQLPCAPGAPAGDALDQRP